MRLVDRPTTAAVSGRPAGCGARSCSAAASRVGADSGGEYLSTIGRVDCLRQRVGVAGGKHQARLVWLDQLLHPCVLGDDHGNARRERLGRSVGESLLITWMDAEPRLAQ